MRIGRYYPEGAAGCCPAGIYAILMTEGSLSLKDNGGGVKTLQSYVKASHSDFAIVLGEHAQRSKFYSADLTSFELPATPEGESYIWEFWKCAVNGVYDRDDDTLLGTDSFLWDGENYVDSRVSSLEKTHSYEVSVAASFDSNFNTLYCMASLIRDGEHVTDPSSCVIKIVTNGNVVVAESTLTYQQLAESPGVFSWEEPGQNLMPDRVYAMSVTIFDAEGQSHQSVVYQITWD